MTATPEVATRRARFEALWPTLEPRVRRALVAAYGPELGGDAAADAMAWAWEHFEKLEAMENPAGYLWRVGQTSVRRTARRQAWQPPPDRRPVDERAFEPALDRAVAGLPLRQRTAVLLVHGYGYPLNEAADVLGCRIRTLRHHLDRGLAKLRDALGVNDDA